MIGERTGGDGGSPRNHGEAVDGADYQAANPSTTNGPAGGDDTRPDTAAGGGEPADPSEPSRRPRASEPDWGSPPSRLGLPNSPGAPLTVRQAGYCAPRRSPPFQYWWIWRGKSRPRCSPQCIPVTRRRRFFFRKTGGVEETLGESLPLRHLKVAWRKPRRIRPFRTPGASGVAPGCSPNLP